MGIEFYRDGKRITDLKVLESFNKEPFVYGALSGVRREFDNDKANLPEGEPKPNSLYNI